MFKILLSIFVCAAASLFSVWVVNALVSVPYVIAGVVDLSLQACSSVTSEDVAVLGECCPPVRDSCLNILILVFLWCCISVPGRCSFQRSRFEYCRNILVCRRFPLSPLSSTCSTSDTGIHFHQLIPVAFVVVHVVY